MRIAERPYVQAVVADAANIEVGKPASITVQFHNTGRTPALDTKMWSKIEMFEKPFPTPSQLGESDFGSPFTLHQSNHVALSSAVSTTFTLTDPDIESIRADAKRLYVWGRVEYRAFGRVAYVNFCCHSTLRNNAVMFTPSTSRNDSN